MSQKFCEKLTMVGFDLACSAVRYVITRPLQPINKLKHSLNVNNSSVAFTCYLLQQQIPDCHQETFSTTQMQ